MSLSDECTGAFSITGARPLKAIEVEGTEQNIRTWWSGIFVMSVFL